jgi:hypothetical protein
LIAAFIVRYNDNARRVWNYVFLYLTSVALYVPAFALGNAIVSLFVEPDWRAFTIFFAQAGGFLTIFSALFVYVYTRLYWRQENIKKLLIGWIWLFVSFVMSLVALYVLPNDIIELLHLP